MTGCLLICVVWSAIAREKIDHNSNLPRARINANSWTISVSRRMGLCCPSPSKIDFA